MTIDMKYFNVYYFCQLANESMGKLDYAPTNAEFTEQQFAVEPEDFPKISVLREYCCWLIDRVFYEQADLISGDFIHDFNPIIWLNAAILRYRNINVSFERKFNQSNDDYLDFYNDYLEHLDTYEDGLYFSIISDIATEVEYILFQNREFLLKFNQQQASAFEDRPRKRTYIPQWVKRAVLFRDKGCCVFCKKDLTGLYSLLQDNEKQFDHMVSLEEGGLNDVCNIQLTCQECNLKKLNSSKTSTLYPGAY